MTRVAGSEYLQYQGCQHANWGGNRIYFTLVSTNKQVHMGLYPRGWMASWMNNLSSYEIFQANVGIHNYNF